MSVLASSFIGSWASVTLNIELDNISASTDTVGALTSSVIRSSAWVILTIILHDKISASTDTVTSSFIRSWSVFFNYIAFTDTIVSIVNRSWSVCYNTDGTNTLG